MAESRKIWTDKGVAADWQCELRLVQDMLLDGRLKGFKTGRAWRITDSEKQAFEDGAPRPAANAKKR